MNDEDFEARLLAALKKHLRVEREPQYPSAYGCDRIVLRVYFRDVPITEATIDYGDD